MRRRPSIDSSKRPGARGSTGSRTGSPPAA
jgi:hypothetical protein